MVNDPGKATIPAPPTGTCAGGRRLWGAVLADYDLDEHELALLREAVRTVDVLDALDGCVKQDGPLVDTPAGPRAHPAAVEARQQRIVLARLLAALRVPLGEGEDEHAAPRLQRRAGVRGVYRMRGVS